MKKLSLVFLIVLLISFAGIAVAEYQEAPELKEMVQKGELPPVKERLPENPKVITQERNLAIDGTVDNFEIGNYGGKIRIVRTRPYATGNELTHMRMTHLLDRPGTDPTDPIKGEIFESYSFSEDNKVITAHIREGLKWSDGEPVTTEDFVFTYEDVLLNKELTPVVPPQYKSRANPNGEIFELEIVDKYTLRFKFNKPYPGFTNVLCFPESDYAFLLKPKHHLKQFHPEYTSMEEINSKMKKYGLEGEDWTRLFNLADYEPWTDATELTTECPVLRPWKITSIGDEVIRAERNPYYFKVDEAGNQLPYVNEVVSNYVRDPETINMKIISGEIDLDRAHSQVADYPLFSENKESAGIDPLLLEEHVPHVVIHFNYAYEDSFWQKIVNDVRFRKALSLGLKRDEINDALYLKRAERPQFIPSETNIEKANQLLDEVGLEDRDEEGYRLKPNGERFKLNFQIRSGNIFADAAELVVQSIQDLGIDASMKVINASYFYEQLAANEIQISVLHNNGIGWPIWETVMKQATRTAVWANWLESGGEIGKKPSEWFIKLYDKYNELLADDPNKAGEKLEEIENMWYEHIPSIPVFVNAPAVFMVNDDLGNVPHGGPHLFATYAAAQFYYKD